VWPWQCDHNAHLNVAFYLAHANEGLVALAGELGMPRAFSPEAQATLRVRDVHMRFWREARITEGLVFTGSIAEITETDARLLILAHDVGTGELAATFQILVAHVTAGDGRPFPWSPRTLDLAHGMMAPVPPEAAARSVGLGPLPPAARNLARAQELKLHLMNVGAVSGSDCDVFGRMKPEVLLSRVSSGTLFSTGLVRLGAAQGGPSRMGGAALEYRLIYLALPRAGDRINIWGGCVPAQDGRFRKYISWALDPQTGEPWGVTARISVSIDLDSRKILTPSAEELAAFNAQAIPELSF
jgi:acyl-CoA thioester hydrolase